MADLMECMCMQCGVSHYLDRGDLVLEVPLDFAYPVVMNVFCTQCGGGLFLVGKAGEQPRYLTRP